MTISAGGPRGTLAGVLGALLALPLAATILMLIAEMRMVMPGEEVQRADREIKQRDERAEAEYRRRTEDMPAEQEAAVALEISQARRKVKGGGAGQRGPIACPRPTAVPSTRGVSESKRRYDVKSRLLWSRLGKRRETHRSETHYYFNASLSEQAGVSRFASRTCSVMTLPEPHSVSDFVSRSFF